LRTLTANVIGVVALLLSANANSFLVQEGSAFFPKKSRVVEVFFSVDNNRYLHQKFLEVTVPEDGFLKHIVPLENSPQKPLARGRAEWFVPEGQLNLVVCGLVACPRQETELLCADVTVPASIAVDRSHEISFSTRYACESFPDRVFAKSR
jgi:hypothetical protein